VARDSTVQIAVKATDAASKPLKEVGKALKDTGQAAEEAGKSGKGAMGGISMAAAAAAGAVGALTSMLTRVAFEVISWPSDIARGLVDMTLAAAPLQGIQAAFEGITGGGEAMLEQLREQSAYMIADRDLMKSYNLAAQLVGKTFAAKLPDAMKYLTKVSAATGQSMDYMMESLVRGIGRMSPLILDNLGIQVNLEEANKKYAKSIGKTTEQLTKQEQQVALTSEVLELLARNTANMPDILGSASQGLASINAMWQNFKDEIGTAALPALQAISDLLAELQPIFKAAASWVADLVRGWAEGFASLIAQAANWGANVMESFAGGISGSGAITRALRGVANTITAWLAPGSPPALLPDLPEWGAGALDAWLSGWSADAIVSSRFLQQMRANLRPFLEAIDLGKGIDEGALRDVFGADAPDMRRYLRAYEGVGVAVTELKDAREELAEAEESGDAEAIEKARERLKIAEDSEYSARRTFNAEERRLEQRISAEAQIARAVTETARVQSEAAANSARLAEEAKQRAIEQAYLQYRLAVAGTPLGQIGIWEEELAKAEEGSAEYWQIMTRLVELRRAAAKGDGEDIGAAMGEGVDDGLTGAMQKAGGGLTEKIDWAGIGSAMAGALWRGFMDALNKLPLELLGWSIDFRDWASSSGVATQMTGIGSDLGIRLGAGLARFLGLDETSDSIGDSAFDMISRAVQNIGAGVGALGASLGKGFIEGFVLGVTTESIETNVQAAVDAATRDYEEREDEGGENLPLWQQWMRKYGEWFSGLPDWLKGSIPLPDWMTGHIPGYAEGGLVTRPTLAWVGENGPEMIVPVPRGTQDRQVPTREEYGGDIYNVEVAIDARGANAAEVKWGVLAALRAAGIPLN